MTKPTRIQFEFSPEAIEALDLLVAKTGAASRAEVVRRALHLFSKFTYSGSRLYTRDDKGVETEFLLA